VPKNAGPVLAVPNARHDPIAVIKPYRCGQLLETDDVTVRKILERAYVAWRRLYVTGVGARGALRVRRPEDQDDTVSEAIAYGMLIAAYHGDREIFDGLWAYARAHSNGNGLMHWKVNSEGRVVGSGAASDADEDMAIALIVADKLWGKPYGTSAKKLINAIYDFEIEPGTYVMKPGDGWGGTPVTNPSYFDPAYFKVFAEYTGNKKWINVVDKAYRMLDLVSGHNQGTGLIPDWMTAGAGPAKGQSYDYKWDATRVPLRLARDAVWFCEPRAQKLLTPLNEFFRKQGPYTIGDGYKLNGTKFSSIHAAAFVGPVAASSLISDDATFRKTLWTDLVKRWGDGYYSNHLRHLSILFVTGLFPNPLEMTLKKALVTPVTTSDATEAPAPADSTSPSQLPTTPNPAPAPAEPLSPSQASGPLVTPAGPQPEREQGDARSP
jgi:endo-1,4-beta-D-glucanase Y